VAVVDEHELDADPQVLVRAIDALLSDEKLRTDMSDKFRQFAKPHAAIDMADMILSAVK
jgi:UDP-N-acetylglucosamine:LPS N-acetylglucosamine transferase